MPADSFNRLGDLLVRSGALTEEQRDLAALANAKSGKPFGVIAEQLFNVPARTVEAAWAEQFAIYADHISGEALTPAPEAVVAIEPRQAWQFGLLPLRYEGEELIAATSKQRLPRAMRFVGWAMPIPCRFVLTDDDSLKVALAEHMGIPGMDEAFGHLDRSGDSKGEAA